MLLRSRSASRTLRHGHESGGGCRGCCPPDRPAAGWVLSLLPCPLPSQAAARPLHLRRAGVRTWRGTRLCAPCWDQSRCSAGKEGPRQSCLLLPSSGAWAAAVPPLPCLWEQVACARRSKDPGPSVCPIKKCWKSLSPASSPVLHSGLVGDPPDPPIPVVAAG